MKYITLVPGGNFFYGRDFYENQVDGSREDDKETSSETRTLLDILGTQHQD